jgi:hypothetical protein
MGTVENEAAVRVLLERIVSNFASLVAGLVTDEDIAVAVGVEAQEIVEEMIPTMAYVDSPRHPMAPSVFFCNASLAVYLALQRRGVDVHEFGAAVLAEMAAQSETPSSANPEKRQRFLQKLMAAGTASQQAAGPNEFVFEVFAGEEDDADWGMNVKSCAICASFSQHDAMELVPYMCATDDVASDVAGDGLRRTGTIALGAHQCDFRYKRGGDPEPIAKQYPDRIRVTNV